MPDGMTDRTAHTGVLSPFTLPVVCLTPIALSSFLALGQNRTTLVRIWGDDPVAWLVSAAGASERVGADVPDRRSSMVRFVGWLVITGLSVYGLSQFVTNHVVAEKDAQP